MLHTTNGKTEVVTIDNLSFTTSNAGDTWYAELESIKFKGIIRQPFYSEKSEYVGRIYHDGVLKSTIISTDFELFFIICTNSMKVTYATINNLCV